MARAFAVLFSASVLAVSIGGCSAGGAAKTGEGAGGAAAAAAPASNSGAGVLEARESELVARYGKLSQEILKAHPKETPEQNQAEMALVRELIGIYAAEADSAFAAAKASTGKAQEAALKSAIEAVTKIAQEGDKRVYEIKLALQKGGHHHTKAEGSDEEYIIIDPKSKKALMAETDKLRALLAGGKGASAAELDAIDQSVDTIASAALTAKA